MSTGDVYKGGWFDGKKQGKGVYDFANSDVYDGMCLDIQDILRAELGKDMVNTFGMTVVTTKGSGRMIR